MTDCIFCKIIAGNISAEKVYEDDKVFSFLDINPVNEGHTLVVPKKHSKNILEDDVEDLKACMNAVQKVSKAAIKATGAEGFNLIANTNKAAGQMVFHTHFHIIPRFKDDGLKHWPGHEASHDERKKVQEKVKKEL